MTQPDLFSQNTYGTAPAAPPSPLARAGDPLTSHLAAERQAAGRANTVATVILDIIRRSALPKTYREIWRDATDAEKLKIGEANSIAKRLTGLERSGSIRAVAERRCSVGGSEARAWVATGQ